MSVYDVMSKLRHQRAVTVNTTAPTGSKCAAHGCPNAGAINEGVCFYHHVASSSEWPAVTHEIRSTWPLLRNFDVPGVVTPPSLASREFHAAQARKRNHDDH